jgi:hypothetical protein
MQEWICTVLAAAVATVLVSLVFAKTGDFGRFVRNVADYRLGPRRAAKPIAIVVIFAELAIGSGIMVPDWRRIAAGLGFALLAVFFGAMVTVLLQGRDSVDCGCTLRPGRSPVGTFSLLRNAGLALVFALTGAMHVPGHELEVRPFIDASAAGVTIALLYLAVESIAALRGVPRRRKVYE